MDRVIAPHGPARRAPRSRSPRGWLLLEVTLGGVMASVILASLLVNLGDATDRSTTVGRKLTAKMLAQQGIENMYALGYANLPTTGFDSAVPSLQAAYTRHYTVTNAASVGTLAVKEVQVLVNFGCTDKTKLNLTTGACTGVANWRSHSVIMKTRIFDDPYTEGW